MKGPRWTRKPSICGIALILMAGLTASAAGPARNEPTSPGASAPHASSPQASPVTGPRMDCSALAVRKVGALPGETAAIESAKLVEATGSTPEFCEVTALIAPQHQFTMRLPTKTWTGRYLQIGCGGLCGISTETTDQPWMAKRCPGYRQGEFAVAFGNGGHVGSTNATWATEPALTKDFAYESEHQLSVVAKNITGLFYGERPHRSYFVGCSGGGRQGLDLAQRYPEDFDGIVAGAPASAWVALFAFSMAWNVRANLAPDGGRLLTPKDLPVLHKGALKSCDGRDGLVDGLITDPRACSFDPGTLRCRADESSGCLTEAKIEAARKIYRGAVDENGVPFYPGYPGGGEPVGSELAWKHTIVRDVPEVPSVSEWLAESHLRHFAKLNNGRAHDLRKLSFDRETFRELSATSPVMDTTDPDLRDFRDAGGKLILWHGLSDAPIPPQGTVAYYEALRKITGQGTGDYARLYLMPGMYHCMGGDGPDEADMLGPLTDWVERHRAPERIVLTERDGSGGTVRTRPVFPYPKVAVHDGSGDPDDAASFRPGPGRSYPPARWTGEFRTGYQQWCEPRNGRLICGRSHDGR
ncbi:tannase/feruloyl esterase family alpha/beta hydrolase [Streptomyces sp. HNM0575]|uniref:tannase/feruloyl esterase family alpha/beta hydrolase n=1 Tax=Streptomyces sp. HNM0575 TaxID=2716338 RepID=UPI00145FC624|nr:tannase/feruloyl esterase family alpha/beta hydrolase [Streptomyces sp. HNM0575]NLU74001.1 tannase/feruloyl esterase family alpha/beta hydrolase [Streptomyces sp. HNM0575]